MDHSPDRVAKVSHPRGRRQQELPRQEQQQQSNQRQEPQPQQAAPLSAEPQVKVRMSIKELRAIAHGAGQDTRGMERADLESIAEHFAPASARYPAPNVVPNVTEQASQQP